MLKNKNREVRKMQIINYFDSDRKEYWLEKIGGCEWDAGKFLYELIKSDKLCELTGKNPRILLLVDEDELISFCTFTEKDDIASTDLTPWIGFVYTFPERRGHHYIGKLFDEAARIARAENISCAYISTDHIGLYEKYGCEFYRMLEDIHGNMSRVYIKKFG